MGTTLTACLFLGLGFASCGGGVTQVRSIGEVKLESLCDDPARCEVKGDTFENALRKGKEPRLYLAAGQGPEQYLGKVAPDRVLGGALVTCGAGLAEGDWLSMAPAVRPIKLDGKGSEKLMSTLRSHLARQLAAHPVAREPGADRSIEATVGAALSDVRPRTISMGSSTYWLKDSAFEKRVALCGEEHYTNIIYSITVLEMSPMFQHDLEGSLRRGLEAALRESDATKTQAATASLPGDKLFDGTDKAKQVGPPAVAPAQPKCSETKAAQAEKPAEQPKRRRRGPKSRLRATTDEVPHSEAPVEPSLVVKPPPAVEPVTVAPTCTECAEIAQAVVRALAEDTRLVAAVGFDEP